MKRNAYTVCAGAQASYFYGLLAIQSKKLSNCWRSLNDDRTSGQKWRGYGRFFTKCVRNIIEKAVSTNVYATTYKDPVPKTLNELRQ